MSANDPGQFAAYTPPPPPPSSPRSPWLYVSLGCGLLILLSFGGCMVAGSLFVNKMKAEMSKPLNIEEVNKGLGDAPRYPNAKLDINATKAGHVVAAIVARAVVHSKSFTIAAYKTPDPVEKVLSYYSDELTKRGYHERQSRQNQQHMYQKGDDVIGVQDHIAGAEDEGTEFFLMRFHGAKTMPQSGDGD